MPWTFKSAAVKASCPDELREKEAALAPLKLGKPLHRQREHNHLRFEYAVPRQLDSWQRSEVYPFSHYTAIFECAGTPQAVELATKIIQALRKPSAGLTGISFNMNPGFYVYVSLHVDDQKWTMYLRNSVSGAVDFPDDLVTPWSLVPDASVTLRPDSGPEEKMATWSVSDLADRFSSDEPIKLIFEASSAKLAAPICSALERYTQQRIGRSYANVEISPADYQSTLASLMKELPGFVSTGTFCVYRKGFDPYERPPEADQGHVVRFPLFKKAIRGADVQVDAVHRPAGDCLFDIQVSHYDNPKAPPRVLSQLLDKIDIPYEVWEGEPLGRWE